MGKPKTPRTPAGYITKASRFIRLRNGRVLDAHDYGLKVFVFDVSKEKDAEYQAARAEREKKNPS